MAPHESTEIRLVCKADYFDPQLKNQLHQIAENLKLLLRTGRKRFALKKIQPWNSVKVTFDIPKEAADRLRLLAIEGNKCLIELGILSVEIAGQVHAVLVSNNGKNPSTTPTKSKELPVSLDMNEDDHRSKRIKLESDGISSAKNNLIQSPLTNFNNHSPQQISPSTHLTTIMNSGTISNATLSNNAMPFDGNDLHESWL